MNPDEIRDLIEGGTLAVPYKIVTKDGRTYTVEDARNARISQAYPDTLIIVRRGLTLAMVRLATIAAITPLSSGPASAGGGPK